MSSGKTEPAEPTSPVYGPAPAKPKIEPPPLLCSTHLRVPKLPPSE